MAPIPGTVKRSVLVALTLLLAGCAEPVQLEYKNPLASLTTQKRGPFADRSLRVTLSENTRNSLQIMEITRRGALRYYPRELDPRRVIDELNSVLQARFKTVSIVDESSGVGGGRADLSMIFDAKVTLGIESGHSNTVQLAGIFLDENQNTLETASGNGVAKVPWPFMMTFDTAFEAAFREFARSLDSMPKLEAYTASRRAGSMGTTGPLRRPTSGVGELKDRVRSLGGTAWALVVGINAYRHVERLNYAVNDARAVAAALPGLGFQHVRVLLDDEATKAGIERAIYRDLRQRMGPDDRFFVFFAGHGITVRLPRGGEEGYLVPVDGDPSQPEVTAIPMDEIRKMGKRVPAKHIFFAIDSCFSGFAATRDITPESVTDVEIAAALQEPVVQVLTAGRKGQKAVEEEGHGLFTRRLLDGLRGLADREGRGFVTVTQLAGWLGPRVVRDSGGRQHPQYSALDGEGDFVFVLPER